MSDYLPREILIEILKRLPVKSLIRFICVCKQWQSLITNPSFITTHLHQTIATNKSNPSSSSRLLFSHYSKGRGYFTVHCDDQSFGHQELNFPFRDKVGGLLRIVGSCNGVICLYDKLWHTILLWNPSIRHSLFVPIPEDYSKHTNKQAFGFGIHPLTSDFEVVGVHNYKHVKGVIIYSVNTGLWRKVDIRTLYQYCLAEKIIVSEFSQAFFNGHVHWIARDRPLVGGSTHSIVSFDLGEEVFREMMLPNALAGLHTQNFFITVLHESLVVSGSTIDTHSIWVMKEYGVVESWAKLATFDVVSGPERIMGCRENGDVLLSTRDDTLASYDPKTTLRTKYGNIRGLYLHHCSYLETLVLLEGKSRVDGHGHSPS